MKRIFVLLPILVVLLIALFLLMPYVKTLGSAPAAQEGNTFELKNERIIDATDVYTINVQYPQFGIPAIDDQIKSDIDSAVAEFKTYPPVPHDSAVVKNDFTGIFDSVYAGPDIISVQLILSSYTGGAHPITLFSGANFDRTTGRRLELVDALRLIGRSVDQVSAQSTSELKAKLQDAFFEEGATNDPENFSSFLVSADKVTFIFQQYQVAPYAAGPQEVSFSRVR